MHYDTEMKLGKILMELINWKIYYRSLRGPSASARAYQLWLENEQLRGEIKELKRKLRDTVAHNHCIAPPGGD